MIPNSLGKNKKVVILIAIVLVVVVFISSGWITVYSHYYLGRIPLVEPLCSFVAKILPISVVGKPLLSYSNEWSWSVLSKRINSTNTSYFIDKLDKNGFYAPEIIELLSYVAVFDDDDLNRLRKHLITSAEPYLDKQSVSNEIRAYLNLVKYSPCFEVKFGLISDLLAIDRWVYWADNGPGEHVLNELIALGETQPEYCVKLIIDSIVDDYRDSYIESIPLLNSISENWLKDTQEVKTEITQLLLVWLATGRNARQSITGLWAYLFKADVATSQNIEYWKRVLLSKRADSFDKLQVFDILIKDDCISYLEAEGFLKRYLDDSLSEIDSFVEINPVDYQLKVMAIRAILLYWLNNPETYLKESKKELIKRVKSCINNVKIQEITSELLKAEENQLQIAK